MRDALLRAMSLLIAIVAVTFFMAARPSSALADTFTPDRTFRVVRTTERGPIIEVGRGTDISQVVDSFQQPYQKATGGKVLSWREIYAVNSGKKVFLPFCAVKNDGRMWRGRDNTSVWEGCVEKRQGIIPIAYSSGQFLVPLESVVTIDQKVACYEKPDCLKQRLGELGVKTEVVQAPVPTPPAQDDRQAAAVAEEKKALQSEGNSLRNELALARVEIERLKNGRSGWGILALFLMSCLVFGFVGFAYAKKRFIRSMLLSEPLPALDDPAPADLRARLDAELARVTRPLYANIRRVANENASLQKANERLSQQFREAQGLATAHTVLALNAPPSEPEEEDLKTTVRRDRMNPIFATAKASPPPPMGGSTDEHDPEIERATLPETSSAMLARELESMGAEMQRQREESATQEKKLREEISQLEAESRGKEDALSNMQKQQEHLVHTASAHAAERFQRYEKQIVSFKEQLQKSQAETALLQQRLDQSSQAPPPSNGVERIREELTKDFDALLRRKEETDKEVERLRHLVQSLEGERAEYRDKAEVNEALLAEAQGQLEDLQGQREALSQRFTRANGAVQNEQRLKNALEERQRELSVGLNEARDKLAEMQHLLEEKETETAEISRKYEAAEAGFAEAVEKIQRANARANEAEARLKEAEAALGRQATDIKEESSEEAMRYRAISAHTRQLLQALAIYEQDVSSSRSFIEQTGGADPFMTGNLQARAQSSREEAQESWRALAHKLSEYCSADVTTLVELFTFSSKEDVQPQAPPGEFVKLGALSGDSPLGEDLRHFAEGLGEELVEREEYPRADRGAIADTLVTGCNPGNNDISGVVVRKPSEDRIDAILCGLEEVRADSPLIVTRQRYGLLSRFLSLPSIVDPAVVRHMDKDVVEHFSQTRTLHQQLQNLEEFEVVPRNLTMPPASSLQTAGA